MRREGDRFLSEILNLENNIQDYSQKIRSFSPHLLFSPSYLVSTIFALSASVQSQSVLMSSSDILASQ